MKIFIVFTVLLLLGECATKDVISSEIRYTQVIDKTSLLKTSLFYINEDSYLNNPEITQKHKPDTRVAYAAFYYNIGAKYKF